MDIKNLTAVSVILCFLVSSVFADETEIIATNYEETKHHPLGRRPSVPRIPSSSRGRGRDGGSRYLQRRKPNRKNRDPTVLMELLGTDFEATWMSIDKPTSESEPVSSNEVIPDYEGDRWDAESLVMQMEKLNLTGELRGTELGSDPRIESAIRKWLLKRASCPVEFTWQDLGTTFWPRWVRKGDCADRHGTCSWPPGMNCVPEAATTVHILRWYCREKKKKTNRDRDTVTVEVVSVGNKRDKTKPKKNKNKKKDKRCRWTRVPFPITIDCFCTC